MKRINAKSITFTIIALTSLYVLQHNERFLIDSNHPAWQHYAPFKWWLLPHALFGTIVLVMAPLQFSDRLRQKYPRAHRIMGRLYVVGALVMAPLGAYVQYFQERLGAPRSFTVLAIVDAAMVVSTTFLAFLFAYKRKINLHKQWATRSYSIALVFIAARFVMGITGWAVLGVEIVQAIIWSCLALSVIFADISLHWRELKNALSGSAKSVTTKTPAKAENLARAA